MNVSRSKPGIVSTIYNAQIGVSLFRSFGIRERGQTDEPAYLGALKQAQIAVVLLDRRAAKARNEIGPTW